MLKQYRSEDIMFIDIETVPQNENYDDVSDVMKQHWEKKSAYFRGEEKTGGDVYDRAGIYAEFGKIVCISVGIILNKNGSRFFRVKSFAGDDEAQLLNEFCKMLVAFTIDSNKNLCGHNVKEFDFPYIARRMLLNGIELPPILDIAGKKPWEVKFIDTLDLWKFGDYKHYTSLSLLTTIFGIPSPKDDIDGSQVGHVYYVEKDVERIAIYCEKDVLATAQLFLKLKGEPLLDQDKIERVF